MFCFTISHFNFLNVECCVPQILLGTLLNTLFQIMIYNKVNGYHPTKIIFPFIYFFSKYEKILQEFI